jgi:hypothetical protein
MKALLQAMLLSGFVSSYWTFQMSIWRPRRRGTASSDQYNGKLVWSEGTRGTDRNDAASAEGKRRLRNVRSKSWR